MREFSVLVELYLHHVSIKCDLWVTFTISQTKQEETKNSGVAEKIDIDTSEKAKDKDKKGVSGVYIIIKCTSLNRNDDDVVLSSST